MLKVTCSALALCIGLGCGARSPSESDRKIGDSNDGEANNTEGQSSTDNSSMTSPSEGCGSFAPTDGVVARYDLDSSQNADGSGKRFFDFPWPSSARPLSDLAKLPNPSSATGCNQGATGELASLLNGSFTAPQYRSYLYELAGAELDSPSNHPVLYVAFDGALNQTNLPAPQQSRSVSSPLFLMNVDADSSERGTLTPVQTRVFVSSLYLPPNTLAVTPAIGFPLLPNTSYALVVRTALGDAMGAPLGRAAALQAVLDEDGCPGALADHRSVATYLSDSHNIAPNTLAALTVFSSGNPGGSLDTVRQAIAAIDNAPALAAVALDGAASDAGGGLHVLQGSFATLIQQRGAPPYLPELTLRFATEALEVTLNSQDSTGQFLAEGIASDSNGTDPQLPRTERLPFVLTIAQNTLTGTEVSTPLVLFGPGTGGSRNSPRNNGVAVRLASLGYATLTIDPVMHVERAHSENLDATLLSQLALVDQFTGSTNVAQMTEMVESGNLFFNPFQLQAARGNILQGAVDYLWQAKLFSQLTLTATVGGASRNIQFDKILFFGHSQGGSIGPLLAGSEHISASVLSGASGHIPSILLNKTKPVDPIEIGTMLKSVACDPSEGPLDIFHPLLAVIGHWFERGDGEHYADKIVNGGAGMSLFLLQGVGDSFSPPQGNEALATAARLVEATPEAGANAPSTAGQALLNQIFPGAGYSVPATGLNENFQSLTGGFKQYSGAGCDDPHFVYACNDQALSDWQAFFASASTGSPTIP